MSWPGPTGKPGYHCRAFVYNGKDPVTGGIKEFVVDWQDRPWWANESGHIRKGRDTWFPDYDAEREQENKLTAAALRGPSGRGNASGVNATRRRKFRCGYDPRNLSVVVEAWDEKEARNRFSAMLPKPGMECGGGKPILCEPFDWDAPTPWNESRVGQAMHRLSKEGGPDGPPGPEGKA